MNDTRWNPAPAPTGRVEGWNACTYPTMAYSDQHALQKLIEGAKGREMHWWEKLARKGAR